MKSICGMDSLLHIELFSSPFGGKKILPSLNMRCDASSSQAAVGGLGHSLVDLIYVLESSLKFL